MQKCFSFIIEPVFSHKIGISTIWDTKVPQFDNKEDAIPTENFQHGYDMGRQPFEEEIKTYKDLDGP